MASLGMGNFVGGFGQGLGQGLNLYDKFLQIQQTEQDQAAQAKVTKQNQQRAAVGLAAADPGYVQPPGTPPQALQAGDATGALPTDNLIPTAPGMPASMSNPVTGDNSSGIPNSLAAIPGQTAMATPVQKAAAMPQLPTPRAITPNYSVPNAPTFTPSTDPIAAPTSVPAPVALAGSSAPPSTTLPPIVVTAAAPPGVTPTTAMPTAVPLNRPTRNNNPLDLRRGPDDTTSPVDADGYRVFSTPTDGFSAGVSQLQSNVSQGTDTIAKIVNKLVPADDGKDPTLKGNKPGPYADAVAKTLGIGVDTKLTPDQVPQVAWAMSLQEGYGRDMTGAPAPDSAVPQSAVPQSALRPRSDWYGKPPVDADGVPQRTAVPTTQTQSPALPPGHHIVTQEEYDAQGEQNYINSGRPSLMKIGYAMRDARLTSAEQAQRVASGNIELAQKRTQQQITDAQQVAMSGNVNGGLDMLVNAETHGVPNGFGMVYDKADGPPTVDGKYIISHTLNGRVIDKEEPRTLGQIFGEAQAIASGKDSYLDWLSKSSEAKKNDADARYLDSEARNAQARIDAGLPVAEADRAKAEAYAAKTNAASNEAIRAATEEAKRQSIENEKKKQDLLTTYNNPQLPMSARNQALAGYMAINGTPNIPKVEVGADGVARINNNLLDPDGPLYNSPEMGNVMVPYGMADKDIGKDPEYIKNGGSISMVVTPNGRRFVSSKLPRDANGNQVTGTYAEIRAMVRGGPKSTGRASAMPGTPATPTTATIRPDPSTGPSRPIDPNWRRNINYTPDWVPAVGRAIQGPRNWRNPNGYDPATEK